MHQTSGVIFLNPGRMALIADPGGSNRDERMILLPTVTINYQPTEKQKIFHASKANEILYGGAAGGGKRRRSSWMRSSGA
jgi:hypothetical protein